MRLLPMVFSRYHHHPRIIDPAQGNGAHRCSAGPRRPCACGYRLTAALPWHSSGFAPASLVLGFPPHRAGSRIGSRSGGSVPDGIMPQKLSTSTLPDSSSYRAPTIIRRSSARAC